MTDGMHVPVERDTFHAIGTHVMMCAKHPHRGRIGVIKKQPSGPLDMYLIEFDGLYEGGAYAMRSDFRVIDP